MRNFRSNQRKSSPIQRAIQHGQLPSPRTGTKERRHPRQVTFFPPRPIKTLYSSRPNTSRAAHTYEQRLVYTYIHSRGAHIGDKRSEARTRAAEPMKAIIWRSGLMSERSSQSAASNRRFAEFRLRSAPCVGWYTHDRKPSTDCAHCYGRSVAPPRPLPSQSISSARERIARLRAGLYMRKYARPCVMRVAARRVEDKVISPLH